MTGKDVSEISGRDGEVGLVRAERRHGRDVVDGLCGDADPVDRIHGGEAMLAGKGLVPEHGLHERLRVVEIAFERDIEDVFIRDSRHLQALDARGAALRVQDHDAHARDAGKARDRRRAGIARGRPDNCREHAAVFQRPTHQAAKELKRHVLEGKSRTVEELHQMEAVAQVAQGRDPRVVE